MRAELPSGTVTFLFTDVEGSTRLLNELGTEGYAAALATHRQIIRDSVAPRGGVLMGMEGDAVFVAFPTTQGAIDAASVITEKLAAGPIRVRIGIHTGNPLLVDRDYVGPDLHRVARIAAAGHGGQVLVSRQSATEVDADLRDLGEHRFKDLSAPERVYQLGDEEFPPLRSLYRSNLPVPATAFLGREDELSVVTELLRREEVRLVTFTGPGGIGKTRLALQAVALVSELFPDGLFWAPLALLREPAFVLTTAAEALGIKEHAGRSALESLGTELTGRRVLLFLDNAEHLLPALAKDVTALLAVAPTLTLVVTSRERLRVEGEHTYPVPTLAEVDGVRLFLDRARALDTALARTDAVQELCERLDYLPLALELAAARTGLLSPEQLLERLGGRLDVLKGGRDVDPRQQTLRATVSWSHDLLSREEQETFARLSVFAGGCTLDSAETVCETDLDTLQSLLDKSLIRRRDTERGPRLWMLETIREFAVEQLAAADALDEVALRHLDHYATLAKDVFEQGEKEEYDLDRIEMERDNFRLALDTALAVDPGRAVELAVWLGPYWSKRGYFREGRDRLATALAAAPDAPASDRASALRLAGSLARWQSDLDAAELLGRDALELDRQLQDPLAVSRDLNLLGVVAWYRGDLAEATRLLEDALNEDRLAGESAHLPDAMFHLMAVASANGDHLRAIDLGRALVARTRNRDSHRLAYALNTLGLSLEANGETEEARRAFEESIALSRLRGLRETHAYALASLAHLERGTQPSDALVHYGESIEIMRELEDQRGIAYCLEGIAAIIYSGDAGQAGSLLAAAAAIRKRTGAALNPDEQAEVEATTSDARAALGADAFSGAWSNGSSLDLDQAVDLALSLTADP